jgi:hypothetical protein
MDGDVDAVDVQAEEVMRLDDFQPLVHHRGGVDRDLVAHAPRRMRERGFDRDVVERGELTMEERAAGSGEDDALHFLVRAATDGLMHGVVLGIDRQDLAAVFARGLRHDVARRDENFLVRDADAFAGLQRGVDGRDARGADDRRDDGVRLRHRGDGARAFDAGDDLDRNLHERAQALRIGIAAHGDERGTIALDLFGEQLDVRTGREAANAQAIGERVDDGERALADGTGAAEDGEAIMCVELLSY